MPDLSINQSSDSNTVHQEVSPQVINAVWNQFQEKLTTGNDVAAQVGIKRDPEKIAAAVAEEESARKYLDDARQMYQETLLSSGW